MSQEDCCAGLFLFQLEADVVRSHCEHYRVKTLQKKGVKPKTSGHYEERSSNKTRNILNGKGVEE